MDAEPVIMQRANEISRVALDGRLTQSGERCTFVVINERTGHYAFMRAFAVAVVLAATQTAAPAGCSPTHKVCNIYYHGIYVQGGQVRDVVTPVCDRPPIEHEIEAWMEYRRIGEYSPLARRHAYSWIIPDKTGFPLDVSSGTCVEGWYRAAAHITGRGPATTQSPNGVPFDFSDTGPEKYITAADCAESG